jgi:hypothetical protein
MAETGLHAQLMIDLRFALNRRFREDPRIYIGSDMLMYWIKGDKTKSKAPDVFVVMGVPKQPLRRIWKVWEEGKAPDVIFEVSSLKTWRERITRVCVQRESLCRSPARPLGATVASATRESRARAREGRWPFQDRTSTRTYGDE